MVITGGSEASLDPFGTLLKAWEALRILSHDTCRPFSKGRSGLVLGEGAAILILEPIERATARGARIYAEVRGFGMTSDAGDILAPSVDGASRAMTAALRDADLKPEEIDYINAHGTGTTLNDRTETKSIHSVFGPHAGNLLASSNKGVLGHTLGAAGAFEAIATALALNQQIAPPTANFVERDPECDLDVVPNVMRPILHARCIVQFVCLRRFECGARFVAGVAMAIPTPSPHPHHTTIATWVGFSMMCLGMFMAILDVQVVATSLPTMQRELHIQKDQMSSIQTAYLIAEIISIPLTGFLTRTLTMRWMFVGAITIFTLSSIGCAASQGFIGLIVCRVVQGFSGGVLIPAVFSAVFLLFPLRLQTIATTCGGVLAVLAPTVGPVVGGWITETYSWPWLFLINVPVGAIAPLLGAMTLPRAETGY